MKLIVLVAALLLTVSVLNLKVTSKPGGEIKGVLIARGGDDSKSSGDSGGGSHDSGKNNGSGDSNSNSSNNNNSVSVPKIEVKEVEKTEEVKKEVKKIEKIEIKEKKEKPEKQEVETETELEIEVKEATVPGKNKFESKFPLSVVGGQLMVATPGGSMPIRILPDQAARIATAAGVQNQVEKIELAQGQDKQNVFRIKGKKTGKFLGIIPVSAETETEVNAESGLVQSVNQPLWLRLFSSLISQS